MQSITTLWLGFVTLKGSVFGGSIPLTKTNTAHIDLLGRCF